MLSEIQIAPATGGLQYAEIVNRGMTTIDLTNWWICSHPAVKYIRLLQVPTTVSGPPATPGIVLAPGDILVFFWGPPNGNYSTRPNSAGTVTHMVDAFVPGVQQFSANGGNVSLYDQGTAGNTPDWGFPAVMRDHVCWAFGGVYTGPNRGCVAMLACLWPPNITDDCQGKITSGVQFQGVVSATVQSMSNLSINYNGGSANGPGDYFIAPATEGEPNIMPGDLDGDFDVDQNDASLFMSCFSEPASTPECQRADFDNSGVVACADWTAFVSAWHTYSTLPDPAAPTTCVGGCMLGDVNGDGLVTWADGENLFNVIAGTDTDPMHMCAADTFHDSVMTCNDLMAFLVLVDNRSMQCVRGDLNGNGLVEGDDIQPFVNGLLGMPCLSPDQFCQLDVNQDLQVDEVDTEGFVSLLVEESN